MKERSVKKTFKYRPRSREAHEKRVNQRSGLFDSPWKDVPMFAPKEGNHKIRILPPSDTWEDAEHYGFDVYIHYGIGADNSSYVCPKKQTGGKKPCPICEECERATKAGEDEKYIRELRANKRIICWVIDRAEPTGPKLYPMPMKMDREFCALAEDENGELLRIDHPSKGYDVSFSRKGAGLKTEYMKYSIGRRSSPLSDDDEEAMAWIEYVNEHPLPEMFVLKDYKELAKIFAGKVSKADEEDEDDDEPKKARRKVDDDEDEDDDDVAPAPKKKHKAIAEDDDEDEEEEDEEEEPRKKSAKRKQLDEDEEEEEEESDEGEDEEPAPKKRRKVADEEEEDEEEESDSDDDDEDEEPAPKSKKKRKVVEEEDEEEESDEDDSEDEEDEDEEPSPRSRSSSKPTSRGSSAREKVKADLKRGLSKKRKDDDDDEEDED